MTVVNPPKTTITDYLYLAIQSQYIAIINHETEAIASLDAEAIHQMRVNLRKLRSTIIASNYILKLPIDCDSSQIGKISRTLGKLRDSDVMLAHCDRLRSNLPDKECTILDRAIEAIAINRQRAIAKVWQTLERKSYYRFKLSINNWLNDPEYTASQNIPLSDLLPDLILLQIGRLFIHPAWYISPDKIDSISFAESGHSCHDLRKQIKATRYLLEIFTDLLPPIYQQFVSDLKQAQKYLGQIQDCLVLDRFLARNLSQKADRKLVTLRQQLETESLEAWQSWNKIQLHYRDGDIKHNLRRELFIS